MLLDDNVYYSDDLLYYHCQFCNEEDKGNCLCAELLNFIENIG